MNGPRPVATSGRTESQAKTRPAAGRAAAISFRCRPVPHNLRSQSSESAAGKLRIEFVCRDRRNHMDREAEESAQPTASLAQTSDRATREPGAPAETVLSQRQA